MDKKIVSPCVVTIFGGTGDLTSRKLMPALYNLAHEGLLPEEFAVVGIGRKEITPTEYRDKLKASVEKFSRYNINNEAWNFLAKRIHYYKMSIDNSDEYQGLKKYLENIDGSVGTKGNRLYYLSVAPSFFEIITLNLKNNAMAQNRNSWQRLVIEKPFGHNLKTAIYLNKVITEVFPPENIFRIDHYLGKEMLQNLFVVRFGNTMFESIWNSKHISNIQITSSETVGVESRAQYYESSGALKDMLQNHMLQLLAYTAMEPPASLDARSIRNEKVKFFESLTKMDQASIRKNVIRGQYGIGTIGYQNMPGYRDEAGINSDSNTETYVAMKLSASNFRWAGTPFYLRTGKRMKDKTTSIVLEFKSIPELFFFKELKGMQPNLLEIRIQPTEGISFSFNAKTPGTKNEISNVKMDFCQSCTYVNNSPESYERLISDVLHNDQTLFTSWEEIEASWKFVDNITDTWQRDPPSFPNYPAGSWGPVEADTLLKNNGHNWWNI